MSAFRVAYLLPLVLTAACGGGGGGGVQAPGMLAAPVAPAPVAPSPPAAVALTPADLIASPRPASRSANDTNEFRANYAAYELIGLLYAPDAGLTGRGVTVGVIDGGFTTTADDLAGRQSPASRDFGSNIVGGVATARNSVAANPSSNHGSIVAELIAGNRNGRGGVGVAPDAQLAYLRVDDVRPNEPNADGTINATLATSNIAAAINYAADARIPILNFSLGVTGGRSPALTAALDRHAAGGGLFVIAAGNEGGANPESIQLLSATNRPSWISAGGLSSAIDAFALDPSSSRAGSLADRYIVATYENIAANPGGTGFLRFSGTSGAAPLVAGAAALVMQKWPQLSGRAAGDVLLATARDIGAAGTDPVFGRGLLDIRAALSPVNPAVVTATGASVAVAATSLALPGAFGTGQITALLKQTVVLDAFGRDFAVDGRGLVRRETNVGAVGGLVRAAAGLRSHRAAVAGIAVATDVQFATQPVRPGERTARLASSEVRLALGGGAVSVTQGYAPWSGSSVAGLGSPRTALAAYAGAADLGLRTVMPFGGGEVTLDAGTGAARATTVLGATRVDAAAVGWTDGRWAISGGIVAERGALFGSRSAGPLRLGSGADTAFAEARYARVLGRWSLTGYGSLGLTGIRALDASLLGDASRIVTSRFGIEAVRVVGPALVTLGLAQPLNVERGAATLTSADGYSLAARALTFRRDRVDLRGDRQLLAQAGIDLGPLRLGLVQGLAQPETGVVGSMGWRF